MAVEGNRSLSVQVAYDAIYSAFVEFVSRGWLYGESWQYQSQAKWLAIQASKGRAIRRLMVKRSFPGETDWSLVARLTDAINQELRYS